MTGETPVRPTLVAVTVVVICVALAAGIVGVSGVVESSETVENLRTGVFGVDGDDEAVLVGPAAVRADANRGGVPDENTSTLAVIAAEDDRFRYRIVVEGDATSAVVDGHSADRDDTIRYNSDGTVTIDGTTGNGSGDAYVVGGEVRSVQVFDNASPYRIELNGEDVSGDLPTAGDGGSDGGGVDEDGDAPDDGADQDGAGDDEGDDGAGPPDDGEAGPPDNGEAGPPDDDEAGPPGNGDGGAPDDGESEPSDDVDPGPQENGTETSGSTTEPPTDTPDRPDEPPEQPDETSEPDEDPEQPDGTPDDASDREIDACTVVDEPGRYEVTDDLEADGDGDDDAVCLHVRAPDVVIDGNGNAIVGDEGEDSIGLLVLNGTPRSGDVGDPLTNVTVRDVRVTGFETGVQAGSFDAVGTSFTFVEVNASGNAGPGIYFNEVDDSTLRDVTASDNRDGVLLWETYDIEVRGLVVEDNDAHGLYLAQNVGRSTFSDVRAVGNGDAADDRAAIRLSTDVEDNLLVDSVVANNGGPGIAFSDSGDNAIRDTTIEDNAAPGVVGDYPGGDGLERVALRRNGDVQLSVERGELGVRAVAVGDAVTVSFVDGVADLGLDGDDPFEFDTVDRASLPGDPPEPPVASEALSVSGPIVPTELSFELDGAADAEAVDLWRYDGDGWSRVADGSVTDGQFTATVDAGGVLVPLESAPDTADEGTTETETPDGDETETATATPEETETPDADNSGTETATPDADDETATLAAASELGPQTAISGVGR